MRTLRDSTLFNAVTGERRDRPPAPLVLADAQATGKDIFHAFIEAGYSVAEAALYSEPQPEGPQCPICHDQGQLGVDLFCECEAGRVAREDKIQRSLDKSQIPKRYRDLTLDTWMDSLSEQQKRGKWLGYTSACLFVRSPDHRFRLGECYEAMGEPFPAELDADPARNSIVFYGPFGTGKTGLMSAIANALMARERLIYLRVGDLFERIQDTYKKGNKEGPSSGQLVKRYASHPLLLLDEFTWEQPSADKKRIMEAIMRPRCAEGLPFVATTNHTPEEFEQEWKGRIAEVVLESAHWVPVAGLNLRQKARAIRAI